jgi:hypothetical protein
MTLEQCHQLVTKLDPNLDKKKETYLILLIFHAMFSVGLDEGKIIEFLGYKNKDKLIRDIITKIKANGIWTENGLEVSWLSPQMGGSAMMCDALCIQGLMRRIKKSNGNIGYQVIAPINEQGQKVIKVNKLKPGDIKLRPATLLEATPPQILKVIRSSDHSSQSQSRQQPPSQISGS